MKRRLLKHHQYQNRLMQMMAVQVFLALIRTVSLIIYMMVLIMQVKTVIATVTVKAIIIVTKIISII